MAPKQDPNKGVDLVRRGVQLICDLRTDPAASRGFARELFAGVEVMLSTSAVFTKMTAGLSTQINQFRDEAETSRVSAEAALSRALHDGESKLRRIVSTAQKAASDASEGYGMERILAMTEVTIAKETLNDHVAEAKKTIIEATRVIQDERLKAVDAIALHTANATRQSPTLPDIVQAVSSLHASTTSFHSPCLPSTYTSTIDDLTRRLSALESSANQKQANIDKLVGDALAKQNQRHQQLLDSLVQSKIDKALAKQDQSQRPSPQVLDAMIQTKIDKTLAKLDKRFDKELAGVRGELAAALKREKALGEIRAKEEERNQQVLKSISDILMSTPDLMKLVEGRVEEYLVDKEKEGETSVFVDVEVRNWIVHVIDEKLSTRVAEAVDKHNRSGQEELRAARHEILDLSHSFLEFKAAFRSSSHTVDTWDSVDRFDDKLTSLTRVTEAKVSASERALPSTLLTSTSTAPAPAIDTPVASNDHNDDYAITDGSDDGNPTIPEMSDDGYCLMEPSRSERAELAINTNTITQADDHESELMSEDDEPPSPSSTSTSTTFDNNGPLHLDPAHTAALLKAALSTSPYNALVILSQLSKPDEPSHSFRLLHQIYKRLIPEPMDLKSLWTAFKTLINSKDSTSSYGVTATGSGIESGTASGSGAGPVMWEGAGLDPTTQIPESQALIRRRRARDQKVEREIRQGREKNGGAHGHVHGGGSKGKGNKGEQRDGRYSKVDDEDWDQD